ncbi:T9SS type A sorting domain-containing protein [Flavobacterium sp. UBA6135]|uniref:T9SS type A sorting domain-containing protein n=1 Tax=Flavobacterium sp. UBA6135 TaxID=1946553 RepID=UPI0025BAC1F8|nr:T9SS type A sorting domain-containing protein [Flavobacterium sp. UBA6135]
MTLIAGVTVNLTLDNGTSTATLVLSGPNDRWFAFKFGDFTHPMDAGVDGVYYNGTTLIDGTEGGFSGLATDTSQNWTVTGNTLSGGTRTITATRALNSPDPTDYDFNYDNDTIDIALAHGQNANYTMNSTNAHGQFRNANHNTTLTTLGVEDFSLNATQIYPNPSNGDFRVKTRTGLDRITIYTQTGALVKTIEVGHQEETEVNVNGLATGVYLLELQNSSDKSWKKIIVN